MDFSQLSVLQPISAHEPDLSALRNELRHQRRLIVGLIDLLEQRSGSLEFLAGLKALRLERDRIRQDGLL